MSSNCLSPPQSKPLFNVSEGKLVCLWNLIMNACAFNYISSSSQAAALGASVQCQCATQKVTALYLSWNLDAKSLRVTQQNEERSQPLRLIHIFTYGHIGCNWYFRHAAVLTCVQLLLNSKLQLAVQLWNVIYFFLQVTLLLFSFKQPCKLRYCDSNKLWILMMYFNCQTSLLTLASSSFPRAFSIWTVGSWSSC